MVSGVIPGRLEGFSFKTIKMVVCQFFFVCFLDQLTHVLVSSIENAWPVI